MDPLSAPQPQFPQSVPPADSPPPPIIPSKTAQVITNIKNFGRILVSWLLIPIAIVLLLHNFVFQAFNVVGASMIPTLHESDYLIISKINTTRHKATKLLNRSVKLQPPDRNSIIVFRYPKDPDVVFVKRVTGLPGERVVVKDGRVRIFNSASPEGFDPDEGLTLASPVTIGEVDLTVPDGNIFVLGDNRTPNGSSDSREWGLLPINLVIGEAVFRLLPLNQIKTL